MLAIRPEKIEFVEATALGALPGIVRQTVLLGSIIEYVVELRSGDHARVQEQRRSGLAERQIGETVAITWRPEGTLYYWNETYGEGHCHGKWVWQRVKTDDSGCMKPSPDLTTANGIITVTSD